MFRNNKKYSMTPPLINYIDIVCAFNKCLPCSLLIFLPPPVDLDPAVSRRFHWLSVRGGGAVVRGGGAGSYLARCPHGIGDIVTRSLFTNVSEI